MSVFSLYHLFFISLVAASNIQINSDASCQKSWNILNGPNGYPDGICTPFNLTAPQSFQIVGLDAGCAVTLYGPNSASDPSNPCSSDTKIVGEIAQCYNSSWVYYSIDNCLNPSASPSTSLLFDSSPSPTGPSSQASQAYQSATSTPSAASTQSKASSDTGIIIGGIVGGVSFFAILLFTALFFLHRRYRNGQQKFNKKDLPPPPTYELAHDTTAIMELSYPEKVLQTEMYAHEAAVEIGHNSLYIPPNELPGGAWPGEDKKEMRDSYYHVHMER